MSVQDYATFWESRYRQQHKTVHRLEDEIARLRAALKEIAEYDEGSEAAYVGGVELSRYVELALNGTQSGTSVALEIEGPKKTGSKPEADQ